MAWLSDTRRRAATMTGSAGRLLGVDLARAVAFAGMLLAHFVTSTGQGGPGWLEALDNAADGRAAPIFAVVLGLGAGLLLARGTEDAVLVRRGLVLLVVGLAIWPRVDHVYLILPHYGVLLALVPLARRVADRTLLVLAGVAFLVPSLAAAVLDDDRLRSGVQPGSYGELREVGRLVRNLLWTGGYPLAGWAGFVLVGLWLARQPLQRPATLRLLLLAGVVVALTQPLLAELLSRRGGVAPVGRPEGWSAFLDGSAHSNRTAWYLLSSATAVAVIAACQLVARHRRLWLVPLVCLGQLALTAYLAHLWLGEEWVFDWRERTEPSMGAQLAVAGAVLAAAALAATVWRARWRRGPVEAVVRLLSG